MGNATKIPTHPVPAVPSHRSIPVLQLAVRSLSHERSDADTTAAVATGFPYREVGKTRHDEERGEASRRHVEIDDPLSEMLRLPFRVIFFLLKRFILQAIWDG